MSHDCRKIMPVRYNAIDQLLDRDHPNNERACVCQKALESDIEAGTLPDRSDATDQDRQQAVDRSCRESFHSRASHPYTDSPEQYVARARERFEQDLNQVVDQRQQTEESNRQLTKQLQQAIDSAISLFQSLRTYIPG